MDMTSLQSNTGVVTLSQGWGVLRVDWLAPVGRIAQPAWSAAAMQPSSASLVTRLLQLGLPGCCIPPPVAVVTPRRHAFLLHSFLMVQQAYLNSSASCCLLPASPCMAAAGHFLWCGERTRQLDGAHLEFMRGIGNPIGVKVSDKMEPSQLVEMIQVSRQQCWQGCFMCVDALCMQLNRPPDSCCGIMTPLLTLGPRHASDVLSAELHSLLAWQCSMAHVLTSGCS